MKQKYRYHYKIQVNIETLNPEAGLIAENVFGDSSSRSLNFDTNTRLVKGELLEVDFAGERITLEFTRITRYNIQCDDARNLLDTKFRTTEPTDEVWFSCKADALKISE